MRTLNEVYTKLSMRRRYEVWFLRVGLGNGSRAWWLRYLLMNPGQDECAARGRDSFGVRAERSLGDLTDVAIDGRQRLCGRAVRILWRRHLSEGQRDARGPRSDRRP